MALRAQCIALVFIAGVILAACGPQAIVTDTAKLELTPEQTHLQAHYLGNAGVMVIDGDIKILFDPLFEKNFDNYQLVPPRIKNALMMGTQPYDDIDIIFISHAHEDHFDAKNVLAYLQIFPLTKLVAPKQAIEKLLAAGLTSTDQVFGIDQSQSDPPVLVQAGNIFIEAVTVPHSGGERFAEVRNTIYRVHMTKDMRVLHLGDATTKTKPYAVHKVFWDREINNLVFTPYWLYKDQERRAALDLYIKPIQTIAIHVPTALSDLKNRYGSALDNVDLFTRPGEVRRIEGETKTRH